MRVIALSNKTLQRDVVLSITIIFPFLIRQIQTMDWDNAKILDSDRSYYKRLVAEMIHIKMQKK